jgi:predicted phosphohydrolase
MRLQYASDLHLEFKDNQRFLKQNPLIASGDVLVLAGDVTTFKDKAACDWFFDWASANFKQTFWLPGNHEYYHYDIAYQRGSFCEEVRDNVFLVNDHAVSIDAVQLIFSTLWTNIRPRNRIAIERGMNDFHLIRYFGNRLSCENLQKEHEKSLAFIEYELLQNEGLTSKVVVTHHVPTLLHYPPQYLGTSLNDAFAVELKQFIRTLNPDYWIYGHHHQNVPEFTVGETKLLTNQLGYVGHNEHLAFDPAKIIVF